MRRADAPSAPPAAPTVRRLIRTPRTSAEKRWIARGQAPGGAVRPTFSFAEVLQFTGPGRRAAAELIGAGAVEEVLGARVGGEISATSLEVVAG